MKKVNEDSKYWLKLMLMNRYIQLFVVALALLLICLVNLEGVHVWFSLLPVAMMAVIIYKGFIQFWNERKNDKQEK